VNDFTASNGIAVWSETQSLTGRRAFYIGDRLAVVLYQDEAVAFIEALDHERDVELGRWRWPENPDYVVYPGIESANVVCETDGFSMVLDRWESDANPAATSSAWRAARAYFDAHPEPKPWHDAECGESWYLEPYGIVYTCVGDRGHSTGLWFTRANVYGKVENLQLDDARITAGRRIYPEVS